MTLLCPFITHRNARFLLMKLELSLRFLRPSVKGLLTLVVLFSGCTRGAHAQNGDGDVYPWRPKLTLEAIHDKGVFSGESFAGGTWAPSDEGEVDNPPRMWRIVPSLSGREKGMRDLELVDLIRDRRLMTIPAKVLRSPESGLPIRVEQVIPSADGTQLLLFSDSQQLWRTRSLGRYHVLDLDSRRVASVSDPALGWQQFATFSPDGRHVAFVRNRDLFVWDQTTNEEYRVTGSGSVGGIINGTSDWVYEEEFGLRKAFAWHPDSDRLAWLQLDERLVREITLVDAREAYPREISFKYPKAGERNAEARICWSSWRHASPECLETATWDPEGEEVTGRHPDLPEYLARLGWTSESTPRIWTLRLNRAQNRVDLLAGDLETGGVDTLYSEASDAWVEVSDQTVTFLEGEDFLWLGQRNGFRHLSLVHAGSGAARPVTDGAWDVSMFYGVDRDGKYAYISAAYPDARERHVYRVSLRGDAPTPGKDNVSSHMKRLTKQAGVHRVDFTPDMTWFVDQVSSLSSPPTWTIRSVHSSRNRILEDNARLKERLKVFRLPAPELVRVPGADGTMLNAWVVKPSSFDSTRVHPLLLYVYGGPDSQTVTNGWGGTFQLWHAYLAETLGVVVASVDNAGTGGRGRTLTQQVYGRLGQLESADQMAAARAMAGWSWVDPDRIGIWGWSYGGYASLMSLLSSDTSPFRMGIAVAPVTDWRLYDTIYTERFLSTPQSNPMGYAKGAPITYASNLRSDQRLLMVHGDLDDNVHVQNTLQLAEALQREGKPFDMMTYPGRNHSLSGDGTRLHLFSMITRYIGDHLVRTLDADAVLPTERD